jgi:hypothetical protein
MAADILFRMTSAVYFLPYEFGKYSISLLFILGWLKWRRNFALLPLLYFTLLIPSIFLAMDFGKSSIIVKKLISYNLSGPFSLAVSVLFFYKLELIN